MPAPSVSYTLTMRTEYPNTVGALSRIITTVGEAGGDMGPIQIVQKTRDRIVRDITFSVRDEDHGKEIVKTVRTLPNVHVLQVHDMIVQVHLGGKIGMHSKMPLTSQTDLALAYTPGVARICQMLYRNPAAAWSLTIKRHSVAVVTDGTAVLGLGDLGPIAALPVMEGKAMLFKEFGGVDAWPICLDTKDPDEIVKTVTYLAPSFGGINLEDISAPRCFEIEERLKQTLDIPIFHDDQHGTAVVVLAALINALKVVKKDFPSIKVAVLGVGAAGVACTKILMAMGVTNVIGVDRAGILYKGRQENMNWAKQWYAENTNPEQIRGGVRDAMEGADVFLGLSGPGMVTPDDLKHMGRDPIVLALANPDPEILPEQAEPYAEIVATGRSDYPNQINNVLCFPGMFRGALEAHAVDINEEMKLAAAYAIAGEIHPDELGHSYIIPNAFDRGVPRAVAKAVSKAAHQTGVARRAPRLYSH